MRLFAFATMLALGAIIGLPHASAQRRLPPPKVTNVNINVTFTFNSEVGKVRTASPPESYDEKGNLKKPTKAELQKFKGDTPEEKKLVGYKAEFSDVQVGDTVSVTISMLKGGPTKPAKKDKADKKGEADLDKPAKEEKPKAKTGKWIVTKQLLGKVTKITPATSDAEAKMTIQITSRVLGGGGGNVRSDQTFEAEKYTATLIVIGQRAPGKTDKR
jgi:hypothetical protein